MRAGPDVQGNQRPEMHDGQAVGVHRPADLLGHEVIHHPEEAGGEEKTHGVVPIPPLHHGIGCTGVDRVGLEPVHRDRQVIDHVQHGDHQDEGAEEPVADIDVPGLAAYHGGEEHDGIDDPDQRHPHRAAELDLGVFLGGGITQRQADEHDHDHRLPAPEGERGQGVAVQPHLAGTLDRIVAGSELCTAGEAEDYQAGVQRPQATEAGPGQVQVHLGPDQLRGDQHPHRHADHAPEHGGDDELSDHLVVIGFCVYCCTHGQVFHGCQIVPGHPGLAGEDCRNCCRNKTDSEMSHSYGSGFYPVLARSEVH